jgi:hypothetical protein
MLHLVGVITAAGLRDNASEGRRQRTPQTSFGNHNRQLVTAVALMYARVSVVRSAAAPVRIGTLHWKPNNPQKGSIRVLATAPASMSLMGSCWVTKSCSAFVAWSRACGMKGHMQSHDMPSKAQSM